MIRQVQGFSSREVHCGTSKRWRCYIRHLTVYDKCPSLTQLNCMQHAAASIRWKNVKHTVCLTILHLIEAAACAPLSLINKGIRLFWDSRYALNIKGCLIFKYRSSILNSNWLLWADVQEKWRKKNSVLSTQYGIRHRWLRSNWRQHIVSDSLPCKWGNAQDELDLSCERPAELVIDCSMLSIISAPTFDPLSAEKFITQDQYS